MIRFLALLLGTTTFSSTICADVLMKIPTFPTGDSILPGYEGWYELNSVQLGIDRTIPDFSGQEPINIGVGQIDQIHMLKPTGVGSTELFSFAINGNGFTDVELRVVEQTANGPRPTAAWKFDRTFVGSYAIQSVEAALVDDFSFVFDKIAFAVVVDGKVSASGWDLVTQTPWTEHGLESELETELNQALHPGPGDYFVDGVVDGTDFIYWQRGLSPAPLSADDLAAWEANFGVPTDGPLNAAAVPEPSASLACLCGTFALLCRRRVS